MSDVENTQEPGALVTEIPKSFIAEYWDHIAGRLPEEKIQAELRQIENKKMMDSVGSCQIEGLGQKMCDIDPRLYFRMLRSFGHHENWLDDFLVDNPQLCAPGYKPRRRKMHLGHSKTFVNGAPA